MKLPHTNPNHEVDTMYNGAEVEEYERSYRPSANSTYLVLVFSVSLALFFLLWFILHTGGDDSPWIPAGLAASVLFLVALAAREAILHRALTRNILDKERRDYRVSDYRRKRRRISLERYSAKLRNIARLSARADAKGENPEAHLEVYQLCRDYLLKVEDALRVVRQGSQTQLALRAGQERARSLQKRHLLKWASLASREWMDESQRRTQPKEKSEAAQKASEVIESALKIYPDEEQLLASASAIHDHIVSLQLAQLVERAERDVFKGNYRRAIERYKDALFYLSREDINEDLGERFAHHIYGEIETLEEHLRERKELAKQSAHPEPERRSFDDDFDFEDDDFVDDNDFFSKEKRTDIN
jgi:hypothetical protein